MPFLYFFLVHYFSNLFKNFGVDNIDPDESKHIRKHPILTKLSWLFYILRNFQGFNRTYRLLQDTRSQELMIHLLLYRTLGPKKIKLRTNIPEFWSGRQQVKDLETGGLNNLNADGWNLVKFDLSKVGYPIKVYSTGSAIAANFIRHAYNRHFDLRETGALKPGDYVIDAGGCWGDTALYFAHQVGETGKVYSFEFVDQNINVFLENLALNPKFAERIVHIPHPVHSISGISLYYKSKGPSTRVSPIKLSDSDVETLTMSIDDFINENLIPKVDFIKMDIEGAELNALKGAVKTIKKHRPKLAICLYHKKSDFIEIPRFIDGLGVYSSYSIGHNSIHAHETILFCE